MHDPRGTSQQQIRGFRGTTALRDAVDEAWSLRKPSDKEMERVGFSSRLITVEKSRAGRGGSKLLLKMLEDLTFELKDYVELDHRKRHASFHR
jgi:hypothetical protein